MLALAEKYIPDLKPGQNVVALAMRKGRIIAIGRNSYVKTHPMQARLAKKVGNEKRVYLHAEISAIIKARGCADTLMVIRRTKTGLGLAKPCPICQLAIEQANLKVIHS